MGVYDWSSYETALAPPTCGIATTEFGITTSGKFSMRHRSRARQRLTEETKKKTRSGGAWEFSGVATPNLQHARDRRLYALWRQNAKLKDCLVVRSRDGLQLLAFDVTRLQLTWERNTCLSFAPGYPALNYFFLFSSNNVRSPSTYLSKRRCQVTLFSPLHLWREYTKDGVRFLRGSGLCRAILSTFLPVMCLYVSDV